MNYSPANKGEGGGPDGRISTPTTLEASACGGSKRRMEVGCCAALQLDWLASTPTRFGNLGTNRVDGRWDEREEEAWWLAPNSTSTCQREGEME
uniref:Uncharacterized protein n=1 Tax=Setaria viridis TaxID=4556 RepID=A0A4U6SPT5_SETVI|nr:hypothetical protein SEVIR_9G008250v2 [Setaria viridis]